MNDDRSNASAGATVPDQRKQRASRRLLAAVLLIGLAIVGLALMERWRQKPDIAAPSHQPSQALIAPPEAPAESDQTDHPSEPPPPPQVVNSSEKPGASAKPAARSPVVSSGVAARPTGVADATYVVQVGVFNSPANAQALQNKLVKAGIPAHTETRVQLGPFRDRHEAETALAKVRKLGVNAVLVAPR